MSCPRCNSNNIGKGGAYVTKMFKLRNRWKCKDCLKRFLVVPKIDDIDKDRQERVVKLHRAKNPYKSKYDNMLARTFSVWEISKIMKITPSTVKKILAVYP